MAFLENLPLKHSEENFLFVHGSPRDPLNEYVFPEHVFNQREVTDALLASRSADFD